MHSPLARANPGAHREEQADQLTSSGTRWVCPCTERSKRCRRSTRRGSVASAQLRPPAQDPDDRRASLRAQSGATLRETQQGQPCTWEEEGPRTKRAQRCCRMLGAHKEKAMLDADENHPIGRLGRPATTAVCCSRRWVAAVRGRARSIENARPRGWARALALTMHRARPPNIKVCHRAPACTETSRAYCAC